MRDAVGTIVPRSSGLPLYAVAAGKAAWPMAQELAAAGTPITAGLIAGPRTSSLPVPAPWHWLAGSHPVPDTVSVEAGMRALSLAAESCAGLLLVLLSGGASSIVAVPAPGLSLADKVKASVALMRAGAPIAELNAVRKHLSAIKGGRLAAGAAATLTLALSDVVGDDPAVIGSGPTVADPTTFADALQIATAGYPDAEVPPAVVSHLERGVRGEMAETPKPGDPRLARSEFHLLANRHTAMNGAANAARALGFRVVLFEAPSEGNAREAGRRFAVSGIEKGGGGPVCVIASGETTVRVTGHGRGGRNQEFALGAASVLRDCPGTMLASVGTDGIDGPTDAAGAIVDATTESRARKAGLSIAAALDDHDAYPFFGRLGDLVTWGATGTNTGDLHVLLIP